MGVCHIKGRCPSWFVLSFKGSSRHVSPGLSDRRKSREGKRPSHVVHTHAHARMLRGLGLAVFLSAGLSSRQQISGRGTIDDRSTHRPVLQRPGP